MSTWPDLSVWTLEMVRQGVKGMYPAPNIHKQSSRTNCHRYWHRQLCSGISHPSWFCKGNVSCTWYSEHFTIHKWLRQTAYILTHQISRLMYFVIFGSYTFVPISWMCKKQIAVSHSSTESEIISLDTGLRLDGFPALELWDLIVSVLGNISCVPDRTGKVVNGEDKHHKSHNKIDTMKDIDAVFLNVQSARQEVLLHQKSIRRHFIQMEFHTRWVESFVDFVKYQSFQFYSLLRCNDKTSSTRFRRKTCQSNRDPW